MIGGYLRTNHMDEYSLLSGWGCYQAGTGFVGQEHFPTTGVYRIEQWG